ncbi:MAG TPA: alpha/beta family hydrolase [Candidatus Binataceae bacterium]|nr:alpha/beta family hydrolase [Candidatus Binataceae bacterium]
MLSDGPCDAPVALILAHGAGAPMDSRFMNIVARGIAAAPALAQHLGSQ